MKKDCASLKHLQKTLKKQEALLIENPLNLLYLTKLKCSSGKLLISSQKSVFLLDSRYQEIGEKQSPIPVALDSPKAFTHFFSSQNITSLQFDSTTTSYERTLQLQTLLPALTLVPNTPLFEQMRAIKTEDEIKKLKKSAALLWKGFCHLKTLLKPGVTEQQLALAFKLFCFERGAEAMSFDPIIAFHENSAMPHYRAGKAKLKKDDIVLIDIGVVVDSYHSDMTRTLFVGKGEPTLKKYLTLTQKAQRAALELCRPGTRLGDLDLAARSVFKKAHVEHLFIHSLGHGIGLEVHEFPRIKQGGKDQDIRLQAGMAITIEPGLYLPDTGGVRYEDTIIITKTGFDNLYQA